MSFLISSLQIIDETQRGTQALILAPTRELANQIHTICKELSTYMGIHVHICVGGTRTREDMEALNKLPHIVIGTPGRVLDMISRGALKTDQLKMFALDEADELLSRGFTEQIYDIFQYLNGEIQICLFSATMPPQVSSDITNLSPSFPFHEHFHFSKIFAFCSNVLLVFRPETYPRSFSS